MDILIKIIITMLVEGDIKTVMTVLMVISMASFGIMTRYHLRSVTKNHSEQIGDLEDHITTLKDEIDHRNEEILRRDTIIVDRNTKMEKILENYHNALISVTNSFHQIENHVNELKGLFRKT